MTKLELNSDEQTLLLEALTFYEAWVLEAGHETAERVRLKLVATPVSEPEPAPQPPAVEDTLKARGLTLDDMLPMLEEFGDEMFNGK